MRLKYLNRKSLFLFPPLVVLRRAPRRDWTPEGPGMALRDVRLVERVDGDGVGKEEEAQQEVVVRLKGHAPWLQQSSPGLRRCAREAAATSPSGQDGHSHFAASQTAPLQHFKSGLLELQEGVVLRSSNAATACSGSGP